MDLEEKRVLKSAITAVGGYTPDTILSNHKLEQMVDTNDEWIQSRTGIKERRILADKDKATSYLAIQAAQDLISKKNLDPTTIDLVLCSNNHSRRSRSRYRSLCCLFPRRYKRLCL